jgi:acetyl esterase/lipase
LGADINVIDNNGETAMHGAAYQSRGDLARVLVKNGADVAVWNHENRAGWTPLVIARGYRPGNFRPSPPTISAIEEAMSTAGVKVPTDLNPGSHRRVWTSTGNKGTPWVVKDIEYGRVGDLVLLLDLHMPQKVTDSNLVVWVHGGAWRSGSKQSMPLSSLVDAGYTVASVEYRLSPVAPFPAQIHDIKAAIRFLRAISSRYGYRSDRIAIAGDSAGGHLAALVGTTNGHRELEGTIGDHLDQSSNVQAIIDYYGPTNLMTIVEQSTPHGIGVRVPALQLLLRGQPEDNPELAKLASPVEHVDGSDPPLLLIHGDQDPQVPINQAHELQGKYKQLSLPVLFEVVYGAAHGGERYHDDAVISVVQSFLKENLRPR